MLQVAVVGGEIQVLEVPEPVVSPGSLLVRTSHSLISAGTESAAVGSGGRREGLVLKALRNPDLVRKVVDRVVSHGLQHTVDLVRAKISTHQPMGYSCAGVVAEVGSGVEGFRPGDRVACCGAGYANHAGVNLVPKNLVARLPENVTFEEGAFGTLGAIALHAVRRSGATLGDRVAVMGLGLLGLLTAQLLRACGAVVLGGDRRGERVERAKGLGLHDGFSVVDREFPAGILERTEGRGADVVIVTAAGGDVGLLNTAFEACRKKGRVVLVGDVPIRIHRDRIYKKEIDFLVSTSYGPGRYDPSYEERGHDYPFAYVRWTEGRNLEEVTRLIGEGALKVRPLVDATYPIQEASAAYASLTSEPPPVGVLLDHQLAEAPSLLSPAARRYAPRRSTAPGPGTARYGVGVVGYGSYFRSTLLPLLREHGGFRLSAACARTGLTVRSAVDKNGFAKGTTDYEELVNDPDVDVVFVATRHDLHHAVATAAVEAGKAVFVEKPMTMTSAQGRELVELVRERQTLLTVGFNRRFSPNVARMKELLRPVAGPRTLLYRVNAGPLPPDHWLLDPEAGGGRLLGEGVHFFDLLAFLAGAEPKRVCSAPLRGAEGDEAAVTLEFADGSVGVVVYTGGGSSAAGKERLEVFAGGGTCVIDDFRSLEVFGLKGRGSTSRSIEKGQRQQLENLHQALRGETDLGVTPEDGLRATWCAEQAVSGAQEV